MLRAAHTQPSSPSPPSSALLGHLWATRTSSYVPVHVVGFTVFLLAYCSSNRGVLPMMSQILNQPAPASRLHTQKGAGHEPRKVRWGGLITTPLSTPHSETQPVPGHTASPSLQPGAGQGWQWSTRVPAARSHSTPTHSPDT